MALPSSISYRSVDATALGAPIQLVGRSPLVRESADCSLLSGYEWMGSEDELGYFVVAWLLWPVFGWLDGVLFLLFRWGAPLCPFVFCPDPSLDATALGAPTQTRGAEPTRTRVG